MFYLIYLQLRKRLATVTGSASNAEEGPTLVACAIEAETDDLPENCSEQTTPEVTGHSTPVSTTTQSSRRSSQTHATNQILEALVASSERHSQLINLSESVLRSQQVPSGLHRERHQFNLWCGSVLQELPQSLYEQCEAEAFRLLTHYRNLAHQYQCG